MIEAANVPSPVRLHRLVTVAVGLTLLTLGWLSWAGFQGYRFATQDVPNLLRLEELRGQILQLDEVLTMSARMAAATGGAEWEARYRRFDPLLDAALKDALSLAPDVGHSPAAAQTDAANAKLVAMENRAFALVRQGQRAEAQQVLAGAEYAAEKQTYAAGMTELNRLLAAHVATVPAATKGRLQWSVGIAALAVPALLLAWWLVLRASAGWRSALAHSNEQLSRHSTELAQSNELLNRHTTELAQSNERLNQQATELAAAGQVLDARVAERTKQFIASERAALNMMEDAVGSREKTEHTLAELQREMAERKKFEAQFLQSQKLEGIGQLAGGVAHDFNNILGAMMMQSELTLMTEQLSEGVREALLQIHAGCERAANLTRQLLLFSRKQVMQARDLDLNESVTSMSKMLQRIIGEDVRLQLSLHPTALLTHADAGMLDQVLMNLAVNARDAMPGGGRLRIETSAQTLDAEQASRQPDAAPGRYVCLSVSDTGTGIAPEVLPRIFEPFFTTKEVGKGTGLGLATVFGIVKQHHGWLGVQSELGKGTTFQVGFPAIEVTHTGDTRMVTRPKPRGGTETILMAEDDDGLRQLARLTLERFGYRVVEAASGAAALALWPEHRGTVALLLTDLVMPGGVSGQQLSARLRADNARLKVVFMSGYSAELAGRELRLEPGQSFLQKPFAPQLLLETVRRALDE